MKAPRFDYACPTTVEETIALLNLHAGEARVIAGGQSLVPMLAFRLAAPKVLVDLRKIPGLDRIAVGGDGLRLGAKVRWQDIERDDRLASAHPMLHCAVSHVAHYQIRNRGTVGGSLAHADPAAELPGVAVTCDAEIAVAGPSGLRTILAPDFFLGPLTTALAADELIVEMRLPAWPAARRWAFVEFAQRPGDFAIAGIALYYDEDEGGRAVNVRVGVIGVSSRPHRLPEVEAVLDRKITDNAVIALASRAAAAAVDPQDDMHASAAYRRSLVATLLERAVQQAAGRMR
jgi:carbon-monoxide dehydrogenase medium subunit